MSLKQTILYDSHLALGARMVDFGGWSMPVQYLGIIPEHHIVRKQVGLFDVSHMGTIDVKGPEARQYLEYMVPNQVSRLLPSQGLYTQICQEDGGTLDDLLIFCIDTNHYMVVVNAGNRTQDLEWFLSHKVNFNCEIESFFAHRSIIALQGPFAENVLKSLLGISLSASDFPAFSIRDCNWKGQIIRVSRSGYTGEVGFELYLDSEICPDLWLNMLDQGQKWGIQPIGLGARDTLRLEAGMPLYGHELSPSISPLEAGLAWSVKLAKESDFIGKKALIAQKNQGLQKKRIGLILNETRRAPREGYSIHLNDQEVGYITSGSLSPTLDKPIGMGYIESSFAKDVNQFEIPVRQQKFKAEKVKLPFYRRTNP